MIIWLHGAGEGGWFDSQDPTVAILGNRVTALADAEIQTLMGGTFVLAPQVPTMWMDNGTGTYTKDGTTMYKTALVELIEQYLTYNPDVDRNRVYIGGCSNGGFMTMCAILTRPDLFAAAFPICQVYKPEWITDAQLKRIAHIPIWQIHAKNDSVVPFDISYTTHQKLIMAGGENIHYSWFETMVDSTGQWIDKNNDPWEYDGHFAWVHVFNNLALAEIDGKTTSLFEWMAAIQSMVL